MDGVPKYYIEQGWCYSMAFNILPTGMSFQRLGQFPMDSSSVYKTLAEAMDYVQNNPTAYPGQVIYVADARTEEEIKAGVEASESLFMITANKEIKLVVSKKDLDMNEMVNEVENKVAELKGDLKETVEEINGAMEQMQQVADEVHEELDSALKQQAEENQAKLDEMQKIADDVHADMDADRQAMKEEFEQAQKDMKEKSDAKFAELEANMAEEHQVMRKEAEEKHAEMEQAMADMKAEADAKHEAMEADAKAKHEEMEAKMEADHKAMKEEADAEHKAMRELVDIEEPYMADVAAYPTSKFLFACGVPVTVEPNKGHKFDAEKPEDAVAFVYRWAEGFKAIVVEKEEAAKVYVVGGHGTNKVNVKRPIPQTNILVKDVKIKGVVGGSYFEGMVGHVNIELNNAEMSSVMGAGWCGASLDGKVARMNVVDDIKIIAKDSKITSTLFGGPQGNGVADDVHVELNNCEVGWLTAGGANGMTRNAVVVMNGGKVQVAQSTNRGIVHKARFVMNDGEVGNLYFGGETEDKSVNGLIEEAFVELNGGVVKKFNFGTDNGVEIAADRIKGSIREMCKVGAGDVSMLEKMLPFIPEHSIEKEIVVNGVNVGGFENGLVLERGTTLTQLMEMLLIKANPVEYIKPEMKISVQPEMEQEVGSIINPVIDYEFIQNDAGEEMEVVFGPVNNKEQGDIKIVDGINSEIFAEVKYGEGQVKVNNLGQECGEPIPAGSIKKVFNFVGYRNMFFGGDNKKVACANSAEVRALEGKEKVGVKEFSFVVPAGSQRVTIAVPQGNKVEEIQYLEQGCVDYKDMFEEQIIPVSGVVDGEEIMDYIVMTYVFAIPCSAKMTFKVIIK